MKHEIKIIMSYDDEDMDSDGKPLSLPIIYLDDNVIGCVQKFDFHASAEEIVPRMEITFPNLHAENIDPSYHQSTPGNSPLTPYVDYHIERLSSVPNLIIKLQDMDDGASNHIKMGEVGTNGTIEVIPMKRK